jgi:hypothetical protein
MVTRLLEEERSGFSRRKEYFSTEAFGNLSTIVIGAANRPRKHHFLASPANALCTSDRGIPNSRAIRVGVTPALNAARTAFNFPCGKGGETHSAFG